MKKQNLLLLLGVVALAFVPLFMPHKVKEGEEAFSGADMQASKAISELDSEYKPWFTPIFEPPSGEVETFLFGVQAAIGAGAVAFCLGYYKGRKSQPSAKHASSN